MLARTGRLPDLLVAAIGGGSNAIGLFTPSSTIPRSRCSASRRPVTAWTRKHAAQPGRRLSRVLHGNKTYLLQDEDGQITEGHSISAGLDYPGIGPEHAWLRDIGRVEYDSATDKEALDAFQLLCRTEGIIPRWSPATPSPPSRGGRGRCGATRSSWPICAGAATRTSSPSPRRWG